MVSWFTCLWVRLLPFTHLRVNAHSTRSPPIQQVFQLDSASLLILPRHLPAPHSGSFPKRSLPSPPPSNLKYDDSLLLRFSIPSSPPLRFSLSLRPTPNLIHPHGKINYHSHDPLTGRTNIKNLPLHPQNVLAYTGWVIDESSVESWWAEEHGSQNRPPEWASSYHDPRVLGWARILVHDTSEMLTFDHLDQLVWEGSFEHKRQIWHIKPLDLYHRIKHSKDPNPLPVTYHARGGLVAWCETNSAQPEYPSSLSHSNSTHLLQQYSASLPIRSPSTSGYDQLAFNNDSQHDVYQSKNKSLRSLPFQTSHKSSQSSFLSSILNFFNSLFSLPFYHQTTIIQPNLGSPLATHTFRPRSLIKRQSMSSDISSFGKSNFVDSIGNSAGCPVEAKVVFIGVAADCTYVSKYSSQEAVTMAILNNVNSLSALFLKTFNISLGLVQLNIQGPTCPAQPTVDAPWNVGCLESGPHGLDLNARLSAFSQWRGAKGGDDGAGLWHLMTDCPAGEEVGVAWLGQLCEVTAHSSSSGEVTSGTGVSASSPNEWIVMAHEIGHNFGAIHDCRTGCSMSDTCCPMSASSCDTQVDYIMSPSSSANAGTEFSPCSIGNICTTLRNTLNTTCLVSPGQRTVISLKQCGNGIVEPGEDCDPGPDGSACCDSKTCKFSSGSVCDPKNSICCTPACQFAPPGLTCRSAVNPECDYEEKCTGNSSSCPSDTFAQDFRSCGPSGKGLTCASGVCTSRDQQCEIHGKTLGLQRACPPTASETCEIVCADPTGQADCILLGTNFVDGTSCGNEGRCLQGKCQGGKPIEQNKPPPIKSLLSD